jgi:hypothetical protein
MGWYLGIFCEVVIWLIVNLISVRILHLSIFFLCLLFDLVFLCLIGLFGQEFLWKVIFIAVPVEALNSFLYFRLLASATKRSQSAFFRWIFESQLHYRAAKLDVIGLTTAQDYWLPYEDQGSKLGGIIFNNIVPSAAFLNQSMAPRY